MRAGGVTCPKTLGLWFDGHPVLRTASLNLTERAGYQRNGGFLGRPPVSANLRSAFDFTELGSKGRLVVKQHFGHRNDRYITLRTNQAAAR